MWKVDSGTETGTTSASYADALSWRCHELGAKTVLLKNTHGSNSLKYKLLGRVTEGGLQDELVAETQLDAGQTAEFHYDRQWHQLVVQVINGSGAASYQVDYEGQGA